MSQYDYDLVILGSGPGGYVAAIKAAQNGLKVAVIEKEKLGGVCLNWGCIPTKALLRSSEIIEYFKRADEFGIDCKDFKINFEKIIKRSRNVAEQLSKGIDHLLNKNDVKIIYGFGEFVDSNSIKVTNTKDSQKITSKNFIIATGAKPKFLKDLSPKDNQCIMGYREALIPKNLPKNLLIIGSGAIGIEFASFYNNLGSNVTIIEISDRILVNEDKETSEFLKKSLEKQGIEILTNAKIDNFTSSKNGMDFTISTSKKKLNKSYDNIISAIGISANIENIGLENTNIQLSEKMYIKTNDQMETDQKGIFAIGDVVAPPCLAHKASKEADICINAILGKETKKLNIDNIPSCVYCHPQVASIGLTEEKAKQNFSEENIRIGKFPLIGNGKAIALGDTDGFVKVIFHKITGELLGAHMVGPEVTEMIFGLTLVKNLEGTELDILESIFPHPTISESIHEAVLSAVNKSLHI
ncbi:MAG: dihydrolipoamide dehydrogenase [Candidatus Midichloriaceae bacterium]|jgi:dihydrolipoamide dehydrogenase